jgi:hypothetical protein
MLRQEGAGFEDLAGLALDGRGCLLVIAVVEQAVAVVDHRHGLEQVARERILRVIVEDRRCTADRLRAEARAGPVRHRRIERNAPDHRIRALERLGVFAPHERQAPRHRSGRSPPMSVNGR